jgi:multidrug resistance protein, MATE family
VNNIKISFKEIRILAIPAIFAGIAEPIIGLVDTAIIGNLGENSDVSQAAVGLGAAFYTLLLWCLSQIRTSISSIVSKYLGAEKLEDIKSLIPQTILFGAMLGVIIGGFSFVFAKSIFLDFYGVDPNDKELLVQAIAYFNIRIVGLPISLIVYTVFGVFRGMQNTVWIMQASIFGAVINMILDYILVFEIGNFHPNLGLEGVAWASVFAQVTMLIIITITVKRKTDFYLIPKWAKPNPEFKNMLLMSANMLIRTIALNLAFFLANRYATSYGKEYLAAHSILINLWVFSFFFIDGFSNAGNAIAGKLLGKNDFKSLTSLSKDLVKYNLIVAGILALIFVGLYPFLGSIFSNDSTVVMHFYSVFWLIIVAQFVSGVTFTFDGVFKGLGETAYLRNTLIIATFLVFWPFIFLLDMLDIKLYAIWISFLIWNVFRGGSLIYKFKKKYYTQ